MDLINFIVDNLLGYFTFIFTHIFDNWFLFFLGLIHILAFVFLFTKLVSAIIAGPIATARKKYTDKCKHKVSEISAWYRLVVDLNAETKYYTDVLDNGCTIHTVYVDSKAKFDRITPNKVLYDYLSVHKANVLRVLEQVRRNRVIYEVYDKKFNHLSSSASIEQSKELNMRFDRFLEYESMAVNELKLNIIHDYSITCNVLYISPAGRNRYIKGDCFNEAYIMEAIQDISNNEALKQSEEWRRKNERSRVTPSLRYDVMRRDGFKCCLCGRSAKNGVELEVDHIVPVSKGGSTVYSNLQTLCRDCNRGKGAKM